MKPLQNTSMESKPRQVFRARCDYLQQHIQIVDAALILMTDAVAAGLKRLNAAQTESPTLSNALEFHLKEYPRLDNLPARQWERTFHNHSERRNYEFALGELYAYFDEYVAASVNGLPESAAKYPASAAVDIEIPPKETVNLVASPASVDKLVGKLILGRIRSKRFGRGMAEELVKVLSLSVERKTQNLAHYVLDVRNLLIHHGGVASGRIYKEYRKLLTEELDAQQGKKVKLNFEFVESAVERIRHYVCDLDHELLRVKCAVPRQ